MTTKRAAAPGRSGGYTFIEILSTLAIAAILVATAGPPLGNLVLDERRTAVVNDLLTTLMLAHSEGAKRNRIIVVCGRDPATGRCSGHDWTAGWMLGTWNDANGDSAIGPGEFQPVRVFTGTTSRLSVRAGNFAASPPVAPAGTIVIKSLGRHSSNGTITICDRRGPRHARAVIVSAIGRARVSSTSASGAPLVCP